MFPVAQAEILIQEHLHNVPMAIPLDLDTRASDNYLHNVWVARAGFHLIEVVIPTIVYFDYREQPISPSLYDRQEHRP